MRYLVKVPHPTLYGHFNPGIPSKLKRNAIEYAKQNGGLVLDMSKPVGCGFKIIADFTK